MEAVDIILQTRDELLEVLKAQLGKAQKKWNFMPTESAQKNLFFSNYNPTDNYLQSWLKTINYQRKKKSWTFLYSGKNWNRRLQVKLTPFLPNPSGVSYYFIKPHKADILNTIVSSLPSSFKDNNPILAPTVILNRRTIQSSHNTTEQVLIQW